MLEQKSTMAPKVVFGYKRSIIFSHSAQEFNTAIFPHKKVKKKQNNFTAQPYQRLPCAEKNITIKH